MKFAILTRVDECWGHAAVPYSAWREGRCVRVNEEGGGHLDSAGGRRDSER